MGSTVKGNKGWFSGLIFPPGDVKRPVFFSNPFSVGDLYHTRFPTMENSTNSRKNSTNVSEYSILPSIGLPGPNRRRKSPLIAPIGRQNSKGVGGSTVKRKERAVLRVKSGASFLKIPAHRTLLRMRNSSDRI